MASSRWIWVGAACLAVSVQPAPPRQMFSQQEVASVKAFWSVKDRYVASNAFDFSSGGPHQPRQTPEGSEWLLRYYKAARGVGTKIVPGQTPPALTPEQESWDAWVDAKYAYDEVRSAQKAFELNQAESSRPLPAPQGWVAVDPGPCPAGVVGLVGNPPEFVGVAKPTIHKVAFPDIVLQYVDNTKVRRKYAYYRFSDGVMDSGTSLKGRAAADLAPLFKKAGYTDSEVRVFSAVSSLEGGFDSVNTYDTGFVSVGFIQFASLKAGAGSLGQTLLSMKTFDPANFDSHFRRYGLDVTERGELVAIDISTGEQTTGPDANSLIIKDKRLVAVFGRAGKVSDSFKAAQMRTAKALYYPGDDAVSIQVGERVLSGKVRDVFKTEAGLATLMDRKVNTGSLGNLTEVLTTLAHECDAKALSDLSTYEFALIQAMRYRKDYLGRDWVLSKPKDPGIASRGGSRTTGGGGRGGG